MELRDKIVLIVGASSGIGRAVALQAAAQGAVIVATARRAPLLDSLAAEIGARGGTCLALPADGLDEAAAGGVVRAAVARFGRIDAVLLNAGGAPALDMRRMSAAEVKAYMRSNYDVLVNYLFPVLDQMRAQGGGLVAVTNSLAGLLAVPLQGPYCAAKAALRALIDTCRIEFHEFGIKFVSVYPGFVATEATAHDGMKAPGEISAEKAAAHILRAMRRERYDTQFPRGMAALAWLGRVLPKALSDAIQRRDLPALGPAA